MPAPGGAAIVRHGPDRVFHPRRATLKITSAPSVPGPSSSLEVGLAEVAHASSQPRDIDVTRQTTIRVGGNADALAFDGACVWVTHSGRLTRIDAASGAIVGTYPSPGSVLTFDGVDIVVLSTDGIRKLSIETGAEVARFPLAFAAEAVAIIGDGINLWVAHAQGVSKLLARSGELVGSYRTSKQPFRMAFDGTHLWLADADGPSVTKLVAATGAEVGNYRLEQEGYRGAIGGIVCDGQHVWASLTSQGTVCKLRADTGAVVWKMPAGSSPAALGFDGACLWAANPGWGTIAKLDADSGAAVETVSLGDAQAGPCALAFDGQRMWVANHENGSVTRIEPAAGPGRPLQQIEHVVLLMMENRSFDSLLGWLYEQGQPARQVPPLRPGQRPYEGLQGLDLAAFENVDATGRIKVQPVRGAQGLNVPNVAPGENFTQVATQLYEWPFEMSFSPPIQMTPRGVLAAGGWRTLDAAMRMSSEQVHDALAAAMAENSRQDKGYFAGFADGRPKDGPPDRDLPGKAAIVVFLRDAKVRDLAWLKASSDEDQRNTLIAWLATTYSLPVAELQAMANQELVLMAWTRSRKPSMKGYVRDYTNELRHLGFAEDAVARYAAQVMQSFTPDQLPVINGLAEHYAVSDMWFSSVPSQTNPNRAFAMCGTSMGLVNNGFLEKDPRAADVASAFGYLIGDDRFEAKTVFNVLEEAGSTWKVFYQSGYLPSNIYNAIQIATGGSVAAEVGLAARAPLLALGVAILKAVGSKHLEYLKELSSSERVSDYTHRLFPELLRVANADSHFSKLDEFHTLARAGQLPNFSYLQPEWTIAHAGTGGGLGTTLGIKSVLFHQGRDYHPPGNLDAAENLVRDIYASLIANRSAWEKTLFVITFDEPVGSFDHVPPPAAIPPWGDGPSPVKREYHFDFRRYGGRVPAILVSPWIEKGTVFRSTTGAPFDHTSLIATVLKWRGLEQRIPEFGQRTAKAPTFDNVATLKTARRDEKAVRFLKAHRSGEPLAFHDRFWLKDHLGRYVAGFAEHFVAPFSVVGFDPTVSEYFPTLDASAPASRRTEFYFENAGNRPDAGVVRATDDVKVRLVACDSGLGAYNVLGAWRDSRDVYYFNDYTEGPDSAKQTWSLVMERPGPVAYGDRVMLRNSYDFSFFNGGSGQCLVPSNDDKGYLTTIAPGHWSWNLHHYERSEYLWTLVPVDRP